MGQNKAEVSVWLVDVIVTTVCRIVGIFCRSVSIAIFVPGWRVHACRVVFMLNV